MRKQQRNFLFFLWLIGLCLISCHSDSPSVASGNYISQDQCLPIKGTWAWEGDTLVESEIVMEAILVFEPQVEDAELQFEAQADEGEDGVRVIFGYQSPEDFFVLDIGGWDNTDVCIYHSVGISGGASFALTEQIPFHFKQGEWHKVRFVSDQREQIVEGYVDEQRIIQATLPFRDEFNTQKFEKITGRMGLGTWKTKARFRNIQLDIKSPASLKEEQG